MSLRLRERPAWAALERHADEVRGLHLRDLFAADPTRGERLTAEAAGLYLDYSKNRVTDETLRLLLALAERVRACASASRRCSAATRSTSTEDRAVLHVALRMPRGDVARRRRRRRRRRTSTRCSTGWPRSPTRVRSGAWTGHTGKRDPQRRQHRHRRLRPRAGHGVRGASRTTADRDMTFRFVSNVDAHRLRRGDPRPRRRPRRCSSSRRRRSRRSRR